MNKTGVTIAAAAILLGLPAEAAWTQDPGHGILITSFNYYNATERFDFAGEVSRLPYGGRFYKWEPSIYFEYGATRRLTLIGQVPFPSLHYRDVYRKADSFGTGDAGAAFRLRLSPFESMHVFSVQGTFQFYTYPGDRQPMPGNRQFDYEGKAMYGHGLKLGPKHGFFNSEAGYRVRSGAPLNQVKFGATAGVDATKRIMLIASCFGTRSQRLQQAGLNPAAQPGYNNVDVYGSFVFAITKKTRIQLGAGRTVQGANIAVGTTATAGVWRTF